MIIVRPPQYKEAELYFMLYLIFCRYSHFIIFGGGCPSSCPGGCRTGGGGVSPAGSRSSPVRYVAFPFPSPLSFSWLGCRVVLNPGFLHTAVSSPFPSQRAVGLERGLPRKGGGGVKWTGGHPLQHFVTATLPVTSCTHGRAKTRNGWAQRSARTGCWSCKYF